MEILQKNPTEFFNSEDLLKILNIGKKNISRGMRGLIKNRMVEEKRILKHSLNLPTKYVRHIRFI